MSFWRLLLVGLSAALGVAGCDRSIDLHSFWAAHYDASRDCLEEVIVRDVLNGSDPGRCAVIVCWIDPSTGNAFVSESMCDGPVGWEQVHSVGAGTICDRALTARARSDSGRCPAGAVDGGAG